MINIGIVYYKHTSIARVFSLRFCAIGPAAGCAGGMWLMRKSSRRNSIIKPVWGCTKVYTSSRMPSVVQTAQHNAWLAPGHIYPRPYIMIHRQTVKLICICKWAGKYAWDYRLKCPSVIAPCVKWHCPLGSGSIENIAHYWGGCRHQLDKQWDGYVNIDYGP